MESGSRTPIELRDGVLVVGGAIARADLSELCDDADALVHDVVDDPVLCNVHALTAPDLVAVEMLARMALALRRMGKVIELDGAESDLTSLVAFTGLAEVLPCRPGAEPNPRPVSSAPTESAD
jgi:hypothetical protein